MCLYPPKLTLVGNLENFNTTQNPPKGVLCVRKPDSVPALVLTLYQVQISTEFHAKTRAGDGHRPGTIVTDRLLRFKLACSHEAHKSTTLHTGRNFAVSPSLFPGKLTPKGFLASRLGRLCSHPSLARDGRYPLPVSDPKIGYVRTFLPNIRAKLEYQSGHLNFIIIPQIIQHANLVATSCLGP